MRTTKAVVVTLAAALTLAALASCSRGDRARPVAGLGGNVLEHPSLAADFTLVDQHGSAFRMADTRGKVVLMTFIYTHCTDICPFEAAKVKVSHDLLGSDAEKVAFVTVTTDPKRDTPQVMAAYSRALELDDVWRFVGGDPKAVQAVWADYGIGVSIDPATEAVAEGQESDKGDSASHSMHAADPGFANGLSSLDLDLVGRIIDQFGGGYDVGHSAPFWFIDKHGYIRAVMDGSATPTEMVKSIRALLALR